MVSLNKAQHELLARVLTYLLDSEKQSFEESDQDPQHVYALARAAWVEFGMDFTPAR